MCSIMRCWSTILHFITLIFVPIIECRIHNVSVQDDLRLRLTLSSFGYIKGGSLHVNITDLTLDGGSTDLSWTRSTSLIGLTLDKTTNDAFNPYTTEVLPECALSSDFTKYMSSAGASHHQLLRNANFLGSVVFQFDFCNGLIYMDCTNEEVVGMDIRPGESVTDSKSIDDQKFEKHEDECKVYETPQELPNCQSKFPSIPLVQFKPAHFRTEFHINFTDVRHAGFYSLTFHNCLKKESHLTDTQLVYKETAPLTLEMDLIEKNFESYLSAGEIPLPSVYYFMSSLLLFTGVLWVVLLRKNGSQQVFRIHWIMGGLLFVKSLSLYLHGVNYENISTNGVHIESWAVLYYITHLLKGALLFLTILLIGSGWAFVKNIFSDVEKRLFVFVLTMQVLANVSFIIVEESEEADLNTTLWKEFFILVDLICCGSILFPVLWSIRHLQQASNTDGKACASLRRLILFRHFYVMVIVYIYFTRIIVFLLKLTLPYDKWYLSELISEIGTLIFFVLTGYKFRPASNNPYFEVAVDEESFGLGEVVVGSTAYTDEDAECKKRILVDSENESDSNGDDSDDDDEGMVFFPQSSSMSSETGSNSRAATVTMTGDKQATGSDTKLIET